jgi:hypothetical protein
LRRRLAPPSSAVQRQLEEQNDAADRTWSPGEAPRQLRARPHVAHVADARAAGGVDGRAVGLARGANVGLDAASLAPVERCKSVAINWGRNGEDDNMWLEVDVERR